MDRFNTRPHVRAGFMLALVATVCFTTLLRAALQVLA